MSTLRRSLVVSSVLAAVIGLAGCSVRQEGNLAQQLDEQSSSAQVAAGEVVREAPPAREPIGAEEAGKQIVIDPLPPSWSSALSTTPTTTSSTEAPPTVTVTEVPSSGPPTDANGNELVTPPAAPLGVAGEGQVVPISEIGGTFTAECQGGEVQVSGIENTVTITGHCAKLTVSGVDNVIVVDSFTDLDLSGVRNRVTYLQGEYTGDGGGIDCVVVKG